MVKYVKKLRRAGKKVYKKAIHPYVNKKKGYNNRMKLYKEVATIKRLINPEKFKFDHTVTSPVAFAQYTGASAGYYASAIYPQPIQGDTGVSRQGNSIKAVSCCIDVKITQDVNTNNDFRFKWMVICKPDNTTDTNASTMMSTMFEVNPFSSIIDYHSPRDPEYFQAYRVIRSGFGMLHCDQITGQTSYFQRKILLRLDHHMKFNTDASVVTTKNKFYFVVIADTGDTAGQAGGLLQYNARWYYVDN